MSQAPAFPPLPTVAAPDELTAAAQHGLYAAANEHDACGVGFVAHIKGQKDRKSHV